jgi:hypothetical protein
MVSYQPKPPHSLALSMLCCQAKISEASTRGTARAQMPARSWREVQDCRVLVCNYAIAFVDMYILIAIQVVNRNSLGYIRVVKGEDARVLAY